MHGIWFACRYFFLRLVIVMMFLFFLYNPFGYNYVEWLMAEPRNSMIGVKALVGLLFVGASIYLIMTAHRTLGKIGLALCVAIIGAAFWLLATHLHMGWTNSMYVVGGEICVALLLAFGLSAPNLNRLISGQVTTNQAGPIQTDIGHHHG